MPDLVSVVIPAREEARHIECCIRSALAQDVDCPVEVIVADGHSRDDTAARARRLGVTVLDNARQSIPAGLNLGLAAARGEILVRFDAHAEMPPGYLRACLRGLREEPGTANIGGWIKPIGAGPWGRALAAALASPVGVGNARIWRPPHPAEHRRDVSTVPFGCFRTATLRAAGGWREDLLANEDFELNHRLRMRHGRVVFDPAVWSIYRPRDTLTAIARQYWRYGRWKAVVLHEAPESLKSRQLAPIGLFAAAASAPFLRAGRVALAAYGALVAVGSVHSRGGWRTAPVLMTLHLVWGAGLISETVWLRLVRGPRPGRGATGSAPRLV